MTLIYTDINGYFYFGLKKSSFSSLVYHLHPPTMVKEIAKPLWVKPELGIEDNLKALSFMGLAVESENDYLQSRKVFFFNVWDIGGK